MNRIVLISLSSLFAGMLAHGNIIAVSNLPESSTPNGVKAQNIEFAISFTTGDLTGGYELLAISYTQGEDENTGFGQLRIVNSDVPAGGGNPIGSALNGGNMLSSAAGQEQTINLPVATSLSSNTEYFAVFQSTTSDFLTLADTVSSNETPGDPGIVGNGWKIGNKTLFRTLGNFGWAETNQPLKIGVTVIPEPTVISLVALFGGGLLFTRRFTRTK